MIDRSHEVFNEKRFHGIFEKLSKAGIINRFESDLYDSDFAEFYHRIAMPFSGDIPIFQRFLLGESPDILDLACGSGRIGIALAREGAHVDGIELSPAMIKIAENELCKEELDVRSRVNFQLGNICSFNMNKTYDLVVLGITSISLLLTVEDRRALFAQVKKHLKENGKFIFDILDFSVDNLEKFDNYMDVSTHEGNEGQEFAIMGQRFFPEEGVFVYNVYREIISWSGETTRLLGSSTKAILFRNDLVEDMRLCGLDVIDEFRDGDQLYFVSKLGVGEASER